MTCLFLISYMLLFTLSCILLVAIHSRFWSIIHEMNPFEVQMIFSCFLGKVGCVYSRRWRDWEESRDVDGNQHHPLSLFLVFHLFIPVFLRLWILESLHKILVSASRWCLESWCTNASGASGMQTREFRSHYNESVECLFLLLPKMRMHISCHAFRVYRLHLPVNTSVFWSHVTLTANFSVGLDLRLYKILVLWVRETSGLTVNYILRLLHDLPLTAHMICPFSRWSCSRGRGCLICQMTKGSFARTVSYTRNTLSVAKD